MAGSSAYKGRLLGRRDLVVASPPVVTSPQRGEARRGEAQVVEATGGEHRPRCAPLPTSPRWGEELEIVVFYEKPPLVSAGSGQDGRAPRLSEDWLFRVSPVKQ